MDSYDLGATKVNCPKCGVVLHLDKQSVEVNNALNVSKWGPIPDGFYRCWGCGFPRPMLWWATLEMDVNMEIKLPTDEKKAGELPEELTGSQEAGWNG